jgi:Restriction endonuclease
VSVNDSNSLAVRAIYGGLRLSLRARDVMLAIRGLSALTVAAIVLAALAAAFRSYWLVAGLAVVLLLNFAQWLYFHHFLARAGLEGVDEMTGWEFERWLESLFLRLGFEVERTPFRGDYGADFVLTWNGARLAVQAKRSARVVGARAVQEVGASRSRCSGVRRPRIAGMRRPPDSSALVAAANHHHDRATVDRLVNRARRRRQARALAQQVAIRALVPGRWRLLLPSRPITRKRSCAFAAV